MPNQALAAAVGVFFRRGKGVCLSWFRWFAALKARGARPRKRASKTRAAPGVDATSCEERQATEA